ncbi:MAG: aminopeptidase [Candidatus Zhuqueibacterota bacterium]
MKADQRLTRLAHVLVHYSIDVKERDKIVISGSTASEPLLREIFQQVILAGGHPTVRMTFEDMDYLFYKTARDFQLNYTDPFRLHETENMDALIAIFPDLNPRALTSIDSSKKKQRILAQKPISEKIFERWGQGKLRWVGAANPSPALAQEANMSLDEYAEFVFDAMHLNEDDPIDFWKAFSRAQQKLCDRLNTVKQMRYVGKDTDLSFRCEGRTWINCDGRNNFPDGEVFTGPIEDSVEGHIRFTYPGIYQGEEIEDIFLRFETGKVVEARAAKGENLLRQLLEIDDGAKYVGEIAIGTNKHISRFTKNMLFDEKMGHTVHLAIGRGIPQSGSRNKSGLHWDMLKDMSDGGEIYADGLLTYQNGDFIMR